MTLPAIAPRGADPLATRIPVTVLTGFLGSGKTTLLRALLRHPGMHRAAVVINEFGDVGIDHELIAVSSERMALLSNGCLCCTLRTDLQETLRELFIKRRAGEVIDFDRVMVETTGLADPVPLLHTLASDGMLGAQYRLNGVVTVVDAINAMGQLDTMAEAAKQVAVADRLVISKSDLAGTHAVERLSARLATINAYALINTAIQGELDPMVLADIAPRSTHVEPEELARWLDAAGATDHAYHGADGAQATHAHGAIDPGIRSFCLWFDVPFTWRSLSAALDVLTALRGPDLLRIKGIVHVAGEPGPMVLQGAQHVMHPPVPLDITHDIEPRSRIVFIVRNVERAAIEALFAAVGALAR